MKDESHREFAMKAFDRYVRNEYDVQSYRLFELDPDKSIKAPSGSYAYILRLDDIEEPHESVRAIPNRLDSMNILYMGGQPSGKSTARYNALITSCRRAGLFYDKNGYSMNDAQHGHPVAGCLTTSLLKTGFRISHCVLDLVGVSDQVDELELLIGYQERFHHLPPWNALRGGSSCFA